MQSFKALNDYVLVEKIKLDERFLTAEPPLQTEGIVFASESLNVGDTIHFIKSFDFNENLLGVEYKNIVAIEN